MKSMLKATTAILLSSATAAFAGGIDRSGQSVSIIFEEGSYAEFSYSYVDPSISGTVLGADSGDMANAYSMIAGGFKMDYGSKISVALIMDQPFGASSEYIDPSFYTGVMADLNAFALTGVVSYDATENFVVFGGIKAQTISAEAAVPIVGGYTVDAESGTGFGYLVGAAYQKPEIALRVALTYQSEVTSDHDSLEFGAFTDITTITTPQSINLEFQSGVNQKTLVFGSVRWVNWSDFAISPPNYPLGDLVSYDNDVITYSIGVGRKLTDTLSGAITVGYEASQGGTSSILAPTDGNLSIGAGLTYTMGMTEITGGAKYIMIGDATDEVTAGDFADNTAWAFGIKIARSF